jgi:threonine aldolase
MDRTLPFTASSKPHFSSDNAAGICPEAWRALEQANSGYALSYGNDPWTAEASDLFREIFEKDCDVYFVFTGTAANALSLASLCQSYHSVITHEFAHVETDECGAPEFYSNGTKILTTTGPNGKLCPSEIERLVTRRTDIHYPKPKVISVSQATEVGTIYSVEELREISYVAKKYDLKVHMDGARFANALAALHLPARKITWEAGVDVLCCGGTKSGLGISEAVIFFDKRLSEEFSFRCKQAGQLGSKMRYLAAPWIPMLREGLWTRNAKRANECARDLEKRLREIPGVSVMYPSEANSVFVQMPDSYHRKLKEAGWLYYTFIGGGARFMTSWQTSQEDVQLLVKEIKTIAESAR